MRQCTVEMVSTYIPLDSVANQTSQARHSLKEHVAVAYI